MVEHILLALSLLANIFFMGLGFHFYQMLQGSG